MSITLLIAHVFVNFLAVHDTKHLKLKVHKFESHSIFRTEEYMYRKFEHLKANFIMFLFDGWLHSTVGRTPVFGLRIDPVLSSACSRRVTTMWVQ